MSAGFFRLDLVRNASKSIPNSANAKRDFWLGVEFSSTDETKPAEEKPLIQFLTVSLGSENIFAIYCCERVPVKDLYTFAFSNVSITSLALIRAPAAAVNRVYTRISFNVFFISADPMSSIVKSIHYALRSNL